MPVTVQIWVDRSQVYLGGFAREEAAGRAYDFAALVLRCARPTLASAPLVAMHGHPPA